MLKPSLLLASSTGSFSSVIRPSLHSTRRCTARLASNTSAAPSVARGLPRGSDSAHSSSGPDSPRSMRAAIVLMLMLAARRAALPGPDGTTTCSTR